MYKVSNILHVRQNLIGEFASLPEEEKRAYLQAKLAAGSGVKANDTPRVIAGFAHVLWVRNKYYNDFKEAKKHLLTAQKIFMELAELNHMLSFLKKDLAVFLGNLYRDHQEHEQAILMYREALVNETNPDRRATALVNMSRSFISKGDFFKSLETAEKIDHSLITDHDLQHFVMLLKARILLILGFPTLAVHGLEEILRLPKPLPRVALEARYLQIFTKIDYRNCLAAKAQYEALIAYLEQNKQEGSANFYRFEWCLFAPLLEPRTIKNRRLFMTRSQHLARLGQCTDYLDLLKEIMGLVFSDKYPEADFVSLQTALHNLYSADNHLLFQHLLVQIVLLLQSRRMFEKSGLLLQEFETYQGRCEVGFSKKLLDRLQEHENWIGPCMDHLLGNLPASLLDKKHQFGSFLFPGAGG